MDMTGDSWRRIEEIFHHAAEAAPNARAAFLDQACAGDEALRREVESLLTHDAEGGATLGNAVAQAAGGAGRTRDLTGKRIGPYAITGRIGEGGMGVVYRAVRSSDFEKKVAVKLVKRGMDTEFILERFRQERQILAALDHPNIARLLDGGANWDGRPYLVMEYVEGTPVTEYCDGHGLSVAARLRLFQTICSAVHYAHQRLVVHRDLKPGHILVTAEGVPKLLDFGIAKLLDAGAEVTAPALRFLTPECASPEQVRGEPVTTASDIYSLGVLLYQLLTGSAPYRFTSRSAEEIARIVCETEPQKPSELRSLDQDLDNIVLKAMDKDPRRRYASVEQFSADAGRHLEGRPVQARTATLRYRASKFVRRNRTATVAAGLLAISLLAGLGTTLWQAHIAQIERARAERRFADVRELAHTLIFEVHDAVRNLPGATAAKKLILDRALRYLDKLAQEAGQDSSLQDELATAYEKLASVQGSTSEGNLGDFAGALASYGKSLAIRKARAGADPLDLKVQRGLSRTFQQMAWLHMNKGGVAESLGLQRQALAIDQAIRKDTRSTAADTHRLAVDFDILGDLLGGNGPSRNLADPVGALASHRQALEMEEAAVQADPAKVKYKDSVALLLIKVGGDLSNLGERAEALGYCQRALSWWESRAADRTDVEAAGMLSATHAWIGDALMMNGDPAGALKHYQAGAQIDQPLFQADPKNAKLQGETAWSEANLGHALAKAGRARGALTHLDRAGELFRRLVASDPGNWSHLNALALVTAWTAAAREIGGDAPGALEKYRAAQEMFEKLAASQPGDADSRVNIAACLNMTGGILLRQIRTGPAREAYRRATSLGEPFAAAQTGGLAARYTMADTYRGLGRVAAANANWQEAKTWFQRSLDMWSRVKNPGAISPNGFDTEGPGPVRAELARCEAALGKSASRP
jgi:tetratricopeptide (TPR) repeat protein